MLSFDSWYPYRHDGACKCTTRVHPGFDASGARVAIKEVSPGEYDSVHAWYAKLGEDPTPMCRLHASPPASGVIVFDAYTSDLARCALPESAGVEVGARRWFLALRLVRAVAQLHERGAVHGDLKLANVLLGRRGDPDVLALADPAVGSEHTPEYRAPWSGGKPRRADDLYALARCVEELLVLGDRPEARLRTLGVRAPGEAAAWCAATRNRDPDALEAEYGAKILADVLSRPDGPTAQAPNASELPQASGTQPRRRHVGVGVLGVLLALAWAVNTQTRSTVAREMSTAPLLELRDVPSSTAEIGALVGEEGQDPREDTDEPWRVVQLAPYAIAVTEVTQQEWTAITGESLVGRGASGGGPCSLLAESPLVAEAYPMVCVSFYDAVAFANAVSRAAGLTPPYYTDAACTKEYDADATEDDYAYWRSDADGFRLPTSDEWEHAARAGRHHHRYIAGIGELEPSSACAYSNVADDGTDLVTALPCQDAWPNLAPVRAGLPNAWGLYQAGGNAAEHVFTEGAAPEGTAELRGGHWMSGVRERLANRAWQRPHHRDVYAGVRLARGARTPGACTPEPAAHLISR